MERTLSLGRPRFTLGSLFVALTILCAGLSLFAHPLVQFFALGMVAGFCQALPDLILALGLWFGSLGLVFVFLRRWTRAYE